MKIKIRTEKKEEFNTDVVYVRDVGDRYHKTELDPSDDLLNAALKIRRIYKRYGEYQSAVATFNDYFGRIVDKYGGTDMFRLAYLSGQVTDYLPPIPKLKNKKIGKIIEKNVNLTPVNFKKVDYEFLDSIINVYTDECQEPLLLARQDEVAKGLKKIDKIIDRKKTGNSPLAKSRDISILEDYFSKRRQEEERERENLIEDITLTQLMSDEFYDILESMNTKDEDDLVSYNGELIPRRQLKTIELVNEMNKLGWNTVKVLNAIKANSKLLNITKKHNKELKKAQKRNKKAESYLAKMLSDNKFDSMDEYDSAMGLAVDERIFARFRD